MTSSVSRRTFLAASGLAPFSRVLGANGDIRLAIVGVGSSVKIGGKGKQDARAFSKMAGVRVVAFCDPESAHLDPFVEEFKRNNQPVQGYADIRKLLENKDIDVVTVTTPNHWHALVAVWACQAGKDVFVQKPASHNIFEGRKMVEAAQKYKRIVQVTSNSRNSGFKEALEYVWQGNLGKPRYIYGVNYKARTSIGKVSGPQPVPKTLNYDLWSGPAPVLPIHREFLHYDWHWEWPYGDGDLGNMGIHYLDGCRMAVRSGLPRHVMSFGGRFGYADDGETPNTQLLYFDYEPAPIIFEVRGLPKDKSFLGTAWDKNTSGTMDEYRGLRTGVIVQCENGYLAGNQAFDAAGKPIKAFRGSGPGEYESFLKAVRSRNPADLSGDVLEGHRSAALMHMGGIAHRLGKTIPAGEIAERFTGNAALREIHGRFHDHLLANGIDPGSIVASPALTIDPEKERFTGEFAAEANKLVSREYRKPFVVPEKV
jgi:predicted dehydrogenase